MPKGVEVQVLSRALMMCMRKIVTYSKVILLNGAIVVIAFGAALFLEWFDAALSFSSYYSPTSLSLGVATLIIGCVFRFWASLTFYENNVEVLSLKSQEVFLQKGPYRFTRNPLYIGITAIFFGAVLMVGTVTGIIFSLVLFFFWQLYLIFYEEKDLEKKFGDGYRKYRNSVPRWF
ncbi:MAG: isoprenylcysteine carboxylmethyltransferase family protein [bacterium]|nr:isoprenylcysteine carboxylmethyltransferase family protein [bacterium]